MKYSPHHPCEQQPVQQQEHEGTVVSVPGLPPPPRGISAQQGPRSLLPTTWNIIAFPAAGCGGDMKGVEWRQRLLTSWGGLAAALSWSSTCSERRLGDWPVAFLGRCPRGREGYAVLTCFFWVERLIPESEAPFSLKSAPFRNEKGSVSYPAIYLVFPFLHLGLETVES